MEEFAIVIMLKSSGTNVLQKELGSYKVDENHKLILGIYAEETTDNGCICHMKVSTQRDVSDWEFEAIYDYYDDAVFKGEALSFAELDGHNNPAWVISFAFDENINATERKINRLLQIHANELAGVYEAIKDKENEYL